MKKTAWFLGFTLVLALPACVLADVALPVEPVLEMHTFLSSLSLSDRRGGFQTRPYSNGGSSDSHMTVTAVKVHRNNSDLDYLNAVRYVMRSA